jgi:hypothetical protein
MLLSVALSLTAPQHGLDDQIRMGDEPCACERKTNVLQMHKSFSCGSTGMFYAAIRRLKIAFKHIANLSKNPIGEKDGL